MIRRGGDDAVTGSDWRPLEQTLARIAGVEDVHVVGRDRPDEIHVVTLGGRSAKQLVRDVQSLASATLDTKIDYRIISVVQLDEDRATARSPQRPWLEKLTMGGKAGTDWVEVSLRWPTGATTQGLGATGRTREARARGAAAAAVGCLDGELAPRKATIEVTQVDIKPIAGDEWVLVHAVFYEKDSSAPLLGSALIHDDVASAAARALLDAVNRKLLGS